MTIKIGEIGRDLFVSTTFDLSSNTSLSLTFTSPNGTIVVVTNPAVTAPSVPSPTLPVLGILPADTYMLYTTVGTEFDEVGDWTVCAEYQDATPKLFSGTKGILKIEAGC